MVESFNKHTHWRENRLICHGGKIKFFYKPKSWHKPNETTFKPYRQHHTTARRQKSEVWSYDKLHWWNRYSLKKTEMVFSSPTNDPKQNKVKIRRVTKADSNNSVILLNNASLKGTVLPCNMRGLCRFRQHSLPNTAQNETFSVAEVNSRDKQDRLRSRWNVNSFINMYKIRSPELVGHNNH